MLHAEFKDQVKRLSPAERDELVALLSALAIDDDPELQAELAGKIDLKDPDHWVSLDELRRMSGP
jgi:hypothetical protein